MLLKPHPHRDSRSMSANMAEAFARIIIPECLPDARLALDIGCGRGDAVSGLLSYGLDVVGVDIRDAYEGPAGHFIRADATDGLPFRDNVFDVVFDNWFYRDLIELQPDLPRSRLETAAIEVSRVLRPGGIIISFPGSPFYYSDGGRFERKDSEGRWVYSVFEKVGMRG